MIGSVFDPRPRELPLGHDEPARFLPWIFALMIYIAGLSAAGLLVLGDALSAADRSLATTLTLQVPADASDARLQTVLALLRQTPGIASVRLLEAAETARLLDPWLGPAAKLDELPAPRLVDLQLERDGKPDIAALRRQLAQIVPGAQVEDHRADFDGVRTAAHPIEWLLAAGILIALLSIAFSTVVAVRSGLTAQSSAVELLHLLGADDDDIAGRFALRWLWLGLLGGTIGATAVMLTIIALRGSSQAVRLPAPIEPNEVADWRLWLVLVGLIIAAGLIGMACARLTVQRHLARMP